MWSHFVRKDAEPGFGEWRAHRACGERKKEEFPSKKRTAAMAVTADASRYA